MLDVTKIEVNEAGSTVTVVVDATGALRYSVAAAGSAATAAASASAASASASSASSSAISASAAADMAAASAAQAAIDGAAGIVSGLLISDIDTTDVPAAVMSFMSVGVDDLGDANAAAWVETTAPGDSTVTALKRKTLNNRWFGLDKWETIPVGKMGVRLDAPSTDQTVAMQFALDSGKSLSIPPGAVIVAAGLEMVANGQSICGEGSLSGSSASRGTLKHPGGEADLLTIKPTSGFWTGNTVRDLYFDMNAATNGHAINIDTVQRSLFQNLYIVNPVKGVFATNLNTPTFIHCRVVGASGQYAWRIQGRYGEGKSTDAIRFIACSGGGDGNNVETIGLWLDGSIAGGYIFGWTGQSVRNTVYCTVDSSDSGHYPAGLTFLRCGGDFLFGPTIYVDAGADLKFFHPYSSNCLGTTAQAHGGDGIVFLADARDIDVISGEVKSAANNGVYIAGENIRFHGTKINRNGTAADNTYDNVYVASTAKRARFDDVCIGHNLYSPTTGLPYDGMAKYGININAATESGAVVINSNCDFRGNATAAINNGHIARLSGGVPIGVTKPSPNRCDNSDFTINRTAVADGAVSAGSRIRDRWFAGTGGVTLTTASDGPITIGAGGSIVQTDVHGNLALRRVWVAAQVKRGSGTATSYTVTLAYGSQSKTFTIITAADNEFEWVGTSFTLSSLDTGNVAFSVTAGASDLTIKRVRYGFGSLPDTWSPDRDPVTQASECSKYLAILAATAGYEGYAHGVASSSTNFRAVFVFQDTLKAVPTSVAYSGNIAVSYGSAGSAAVTAMAFATGGAGKRSVTVDCTVASGLTAGNAGLLRSNNNTTSTITFDTGY